MTYIDTILANALNKQAASRTKTYIIQHSVVFGIPSTKRIIEATNKQAAIEKYIAQYIKEHADLSQYNIQVQELEEGEEIFK